MFAMNAALYNQALKDLHRIGLLCKGYFHANADNNYKMYIIITRKYKQHSVGALQCLTGNGIADIYKNFALKNKQIHLKNVLSQNSYLLNHEIQIFKPFHVYNEELDYVKDMYLHVISKEPFREKKVVWYSAQIVSKYEYVLISIEASL